MGSTVGLAEPFKSRVERLLALSLGRVTVTSGKRTTAQQAALRIQNGCPDVYVSPASSCRVPTARPGESKHEQGLAVDFGEDLTLAAKLADLVGVKRTVPGEPWHFEPAEAKGSSGWLPTVAGPIAAVGEADSEGLVDRVVHALRNLTVTALILGGAATLVVMGGYRTVSGRSLTGDAARAAGQGVLLATTGGTGTVAAGGAKAGAAKKATSTPRSA